MAAMYLYEPTLGLGHGENSTGMIARFASGARDAAHLKVLRRRVVRGSRRRRRRRGAG